MIANRFRSVAWTGCVIAAALSFYMVSQSVAAKRAELTSVERKILATNQEIRELRTAIDTRGGLAQIESWNSSVYGLQAPNAQQFVNSSVQLVAMAQPQQQPLDPGAPIVAGQNQGAIRQASDNAIEDQMPSAVASSAAQEAPAPRAIEERPMVRQATFVQARPSAMAQATPPPVHMVASRKDPIDLPAAKPAPSPKPAAPAKAAKPMKLTSLDDAWLDGVTGSKSGGGSRKARP